ncbi:hypothetical protein [Streptomyces sp. NPDC051173]|uniref:hypothetical protein n=1 Tax=Streptomyces sp. NPDC051173 TaxID=3155164 RepID=UPI00344BFC2A
MHDHRGPGREPGLSDRRVPRPARTPTPLVPRPGSEAVGAPVDARSTDPWDDAVA